MGLWRFINELFQRWTRAEVSIMAASLAFHSVLAMVPLLAISLAVFQYIGGMDQMLDWIQSHLMEYFVFGTHEFIMEKIKNSVQRIHSGALGIVGVVFILFSCSRLFYQFNRAIQKIWKTEGRTSDWSRLGFFWLILVCGPISISILLGYLPKVLLEGQSFSFDAYLGYVAIFGLLMFVYGSVPNCKVQFRVAFLTAMGSLAALIVAKTAYVKITTDLMSYNKVYGSVAALPVFLIWVLFLWWLVLFGVAISAQLQAVLMRRKSSVQKAESI